MHGEVLTLSMDDDAMKVFVGADILREVEVESQGETMLDAFSSTLEVMNQSCDSGFRLRLAKEEDLQIVEDLVQGLADYVKESDAVELTAKDYLNDGFSLDDPLWHCVLIDKIHDEGDSHTCGYAFFYVGYNLGQGRFLYLEDLYIQSKDRGGGGGKLTMKALAAMALSSECHRMYWQALDWNTASLKFYDNIGAKIHVGERTSRYAGIALERFASELRA
jgi:GNAT superfamily N-acetyltransferase